MFEGNNNNNFEERLEERFVGYHAALPPTDPDAITTKSGLLLSVDAVIVVGRTTLCDIMCTTTTNEECIEGIGDRKTKFSKTLNVALPYRKTSSFEEMFDAKTPLQKIKLVEAKVKRNKMLQEEKEEFLRKTQMDRQEKETRERLAATRIQAIFRGYRRRPKDPLKRRKPRGPVVLRRHELREFLTDLTNRLGLKPIRGLTLVGKYKNTKRENMMRNAAAFVLQRFMRMNYEKSRARKFMQRLRLCKAVRIKWILYRFSKRSAKMLSDFRLLKARQKSSSIVIQTQIRAFLARRRVRLLKRGRTRYNRELEAATILQRAFRGRLRLFNFPEFDDMMVALEASVLEAEINGLMFAVGDEIQTELERQADLELMYLEDIRSRKAAEYADWLHQQELDRLRQLELDRLAREAEEADALRRKVEEQNRLNELRLMRAEEEYERARLEELRRLKELAFMRAEDAYAAKVNKFWNDERRRLAEEERLRKLREEEERRRLAGLHAKLARETADALVKALLDNEVSHRVMQSRKEYSERILMSVEDDDSQAQRAEWDRLNDERLRLLAEARRLEAERRRRVILAMESSITMDIETIVVQEELREMLRIQVEDLERQRALDAELARRLLVSNLAREMAERLVSGWLAAGIQNMTESDEMRARRLAEEEAQRQRQREADELRLMRLEDAESKRANDLWKESERELTRMIGFESISESIESIVDDTFNLIGDANFDEAENQLQAELDRLLDLGDNANKALICSVQLLLGHVKLQLAKFSEANDLFQSSLALRVMLFKAESIQSAEAVEALASVAKKQARYDDATEFYKTALNVTDLTMKGFIEPVESEIPTADPLHLHVRLLLEQAEMYIERGNYNNAEHNIGVVQEKILYMQRFASDENDEDETSLEGMLTDCEFLMAMIDKIKGNYKAAVIKYRKIHDDRERLFGLRHPKIASILGALAEIEMFRCHYKKAFEFIDLAQEVNGQFFGQNHPATLNYAHIRARIEYAVGDYKAALEKITDVLRRRKMSYPDFHPTIAECFYIAAECTRQLGNPKMAQKYYDEAADIRKKLFPGVHITTGECCLGLGINMIARMQYLPAIPLLEEAFANYQQVAMAMGVTELVDLEVCRTELAHGYILVGRYDDAKVLLKVLGKVLHRVVGSKHIHLANSLYVLALYKQTLGAYFDANILYNHCDDILSEILGSSNHPSSLRTAFSASANFRGPGYYEDAAVKLNLAFSAASERYEPDSVVIARGVHSRALLMRDLGDLNEASRLLPQALKTTKDRLGTKNVMFAEILGDIGEALRLEGKYDPAALALNQAHKLRKTHFGKEHYMVGEILISQGLLLLDQRQPENALRILESEAVPLLVRCLGEHHPHTMYAKGCVGLVLNTLFAANLPPDVLTSKLLSTGSGMKKASFQNAASAAGGGPAGSSSNSLTEEKRNSARFGRNGVFDPRGKKMIEDTLDLYDTYPQCPFGDSHPWALELGGWIDKNEDGNLSDDSGHGSQSSQNRKSGGQKGFKQSDGGTTLAGVLDSALDSRPPTRN